MIFALSSARTTGLSCAAFAEEDYITVTIQKGDTVRKLLKANGRDYDVDKYVVMVLNGMDRESQMEILTIGEMYEGRNHATVLSSIRKVENLLQTDQKTGIVVRDITSNINSSERK